jgi:hypothetical protein
MHDRIISNLNTYATMAFPKAMEVARSKKHISLILNKKGNVLSAGCNEMRTHPEAAKMGYRYNEVHSELDALIRLDKIMRNSKDLILLNYRFNRFGDFRMSRPCTKCMPWCIAIFKEIIYTTKNGYEIISDQRDYNDSIVLSIDQFNIRSIMRT